MKPFLACFQSLYYGTRGRTARPASIAFNALKTLAQTLAMWALFLGFGPWLVWNIETFVMRWSGFVWRFESPLSHFLGATLFVAGWILAWMSAVWMVARGDGTPLPLDCPNRLVIVGPYRWVRNPMALGSLTQGMGIACWLASPLIALYVLAGALIWNYLARPWEERDLAMRFGAPFQQYQTQVRCWIPRIKPYDAQ